MGHETIEGGGVVNTSPPIPTIQTAERSRTLGLAVPHATSVEEAPLVSSSVSGLTFPLDQGLMLQHRRPNTLPLEDGIAHTLPGRAEAVVTRSRREAISAARSLLSGRSAPSGYRVETVVKWVGVVTDISEDEGLFTADLQPLLNTDAAIEADFDLAELPTADRPAMRPGSVFYVTVRMLRTRFGGSSKETSIRFQRLGRWTEGELADFLEASAKRHERDADIFD